MSGSNGRACPECEAPRRPDGTPSCGCTRRASDALRDARTAQAAAAGDFDPLLIRPYVDLGDTPVGPEGTSAARGSSREAAGGAAREDAEVGTPDGTLRRPGVSEGYEGSVDRTTRLPAAGAGQCGGAVDETVRLGVVPAADASGHEPPRRRRRTVLLASGGAVTVAAAAAAFVGGLLSYHPPQRDGALPGDIRASVPEKSSQGGTSAPESTVSAPPPTTPTAPSPSTSPAPSLSRSSASVPPSASPAPSRTATATASRSPGGGGQQYPVQVLRPGDEGPGVDELQLRLRQLNLYTGVVNGVYDGQVEFAVRRYQIARGITQDDPGVYGPQTKEELESETGTGAGTGTGTDKP